MPLKYGVNKVILQLFQVVERPSSIAASLLMDTAQADAK